jgi:hypothetical protein
MYESQSDAGSSGRGHEKRDVLFDFSSCPSWFYGFFCKSLDLIGQLFFCCRNVTSCLIGCIFRVPLGTGTNSVTVH